MTQWRKKTPDETYPPEEIEARLKELPKDKQIAAYCT